MESMEMVGTLMKCTSAWDINLSSLPIDVIMQVGLRNQDVGGAGVAVLFLSPVGAL